MLLNGDEGLVVQGGCLEDEDDDDEDGTTNGVRRSLIQQPPARAEHRGLLKVNKIELILRYLVRLKFRAEPIPIIF